MVSAATIQAKINRGEGIAGRILGLPTTIYRATGPSQPTAPPNAVGTIQAAFSTSPKFDAVKPSDYAKPLVYGLFDRTTTLSGDYLVRTDGTWFIASQDLNQSTLCVECNAVVSFTQAGSASAANRPDNYWGRSDGTDMTLLTDWPASVRIKTRGETAQADLPGEPKQALFEVLLPNVAGVALTIGSRMTDALGNAYALSAVEVSDLGYRLYAQTTNA